MIISVGVESAEWQAFQGSLLESIVAQLSADLSSPSSKAAIDIAYVIARTGGDASCAAVMQRIAPLLLLHTQEAHKQSRLAILQAARESASGVLNVSSSKTGTARGGASNKDEDKMAIAMEMLAQLIACVGELSVAVATSSEHEHVHTAACSHGPDGHHHHDHDHHHGHQQEDNRVQTLANTVAPVSPAVLMPYRDAIFAALTSFVQPVQVELETSKDAVNPFLAVKAAYSGAPGDVSGTTSGVPTFLPPPSAMLAVVASVSAMRELLQR